MHLLITIRAAIADDNEAVIGIGGMAHRGKHDAAGRDTGQDQSLAAMGFEDHIEVGSRKSADPVLCHDHLIGLGRDGRMNRRPFVSSGKTARGFQPAEQRVSRADLGIARPEADDHIDDHYSRGAGSFEQGRRPAEQRLGIGGEAVHDQRLEIHDEQGRGLGIDRKLVCRVGADRLRRKGETGRQGRDDETSSRELDSGRSLPMAFGPASSVTHA